jgi:hypothetical protein
MNELSESEARERIAALTEDRDFVFGIVHAGESETAHYFLVVHERTHEGNRYLNERYVLLAKDDADIEDTYMKNGINRRISSDLVDLADRLADVYQKAADFQHDLAAGDISATAIDGYRPPLYDCNGGE